MTFGQAVSSCFSKYATFGGRASVSEYWFWVLFQLIVTVPFGILYSATGSMAFQIINSLISLALLLPTLAVAVRRMHDIGKGGGWIFIGLVPIIGWIWFIVLACQSSQPGENRFGYNEEQMHGGMN